MDIWLGAILFAQPQRRRARVRGVASSLVMASKFATALLLGLVVATASGAPSLNDLSFAANPQLVNKWGTTLDGLFLNNSATGKNSKIPSLDNLFCPVNRARLANALQKLNDKLANSKIGTNRSDALVASLIELEKLASNCALDARVLQSVVTDLEASDWLKSSGDGPTRLEDLVNNLLAQLGDHTDIASTAKIDEYLDREFTELAQVLASALANSAPDELLPEPLAEVDLTEATVNNNKADPVGDSTLPIGSNTPLTPPPTAPVAGPLPGPKVEKEPATRIVANTSPSKQQENLRLLDVHTEVPTKPVATRAPAEAVAPPLTPVSTRPLSSPSTPSAAETQVNDLLRFGSWASQEPYAGAKTRHDAEQARLYPNDPSKRAPFVWTTPPVAQGPRCEALTIAKDKKPGEMGDWLGAVADRSAKALDTPKEKRAPDVSNFIEMFNIPEVANSKKYSLKAIVTSMCKKGYDGTEICDDEERKRVERRNALIAFVDAARAVTAPDSCPRCYLAIDASPQECNLFMRGAEDKCSTVSGPEDLVKNPECCSRILDAAGKPKQDEISQARIEAFNKFLETAKDFDLVQVDEQGSNFLLNSYVLMTPERLEKHKGTTEMSLQRSLWANLIGCSNVQGSWAQYVRQLQVGNSTALALLRRSQPQPDKPLKQSDSSDVSSEQDNGSHQNLIPNLD